MCLPLLYTQAFLCVILLFVQKCDLLAILAARRIAIVPLGWSMMMMMMKKGKSGILSNETILCTCSIHLMENQANATPVIVFIWKLMSGETVENVL